MTSPAPAAARGPITVSIMLATLMNSLDTTIANVALPHVQGSVSASADQITWVLTSYIVASAVMTPLTGWLAGRIGRKRLFLVSIAGFTLASMLCGAATSLGAIVLFRLMQGLFGAALIPLSQATLLDTYPPEQHGSAMSIWGMGTLLGPILGPGLGGWLTDNLSWRWVFYINLPVGILAFMGVWFFITDHQRSVAKHFDFFGFSSLVIAIAAFQLMLDRGPDRDWFQSAEIWTWTLVAVTSLYLFVVHTLTTKEPFFDRSLARDRNFVVALLFALILMTFMFATLALLPPMLETLMGYPVATTGLITMPRGVATVVSMFIVGRVMGRVDTRVLMSFGMALNSIALFQMSQISPEMDARLIIVSGLTQGFGLGFVFIPMSTVAFATINPALRAEASSVFNTVRNVGASAGISLMTALLARNMAAAHTALGEHVTFGAPAIAASRSVIDLQSTTGLVAMNAQVTRQAAFLAYVDDFRALFVLSFVVFPILLLLRPGHRPARVMEAMAD